LGQDNNFIIKTYRLVSLDIHLVNNSTQNRNSFILDIEEQKVLNPNISAFGAFFELVSPKADTTFNTFLPQLSTYTFRSDYFNDNTNAGFTDTVNFYKTIKLGVADTTVSITNP
jgi:hypothetical protein